MQIVQWEQKTCKANGEGIIVEPESPVGTA